MAARCTYAGSTDSRDYWPNVLSTLARRTFRDQALTAGMTMGGVMNYVTIDARNLARWFAGAIGVTGGTALNNNGYIVYFSDRRGNHNDALFGQPETGEYGHEDSINMAAGAGSSAPERHPGGRRGPQRERLAPDLRGDAQRRVALWRRGAV